MNLIDGSLIDQSLMGFALFSVVMSITPGPNNVMVTASGATFGFARTVPHMFGIAIGFPIMLLIVGLGVDGALHLYPGILDVMRVAGLAFLTYLAWRIATAAPERVESGRARPINLIEAAAFQWINPKAWLIAIGALSTFGAGRLQGSEQAMAQEVAALLLMGLIFFLACLPSVALWTAFGARIGRMLNGARARRVFNLSMAALLVASGIVGVF
ncbi:MAG: LysE family translocator [Rhodospirillaceae bacterium]|jgi:threonine/homoserine/homoserine lactone efflux protein|nr:LysE family translocator [Rhodospirillaceae bacterium]MBT6137444.1 LysE family translocator [Rhodospirillaceae bacterium]